MANPIPRKLLVTGRLAEPALRRVLQDMGQGLDWEPVVAVLPISVAALMTTEWVIEHLKPPEDIHSIVLPGLCRGTIQSVADAFGVPAELGPTDLRDLPDHFGQTPTALPDYGEFDIEIIAEINSASKLGRRELLRLARQHRADGADVIDLGCDPGSTWVGVTDAVRALRDEGIRVSIDSMNVAEISAAASAGAELVLSVNAGNRIAAPDWGIEVVAIPDEPSLLSGLDRTIEFLDQRHVKFRIDPILEPIGFGFAASLQRCFEVRRRYPSESMMLGVGNLTELTDVDSAGINVLMTAFCQEICIHSILTTEVIAWCRTCVREIDVARRLVAHAIRHRVLPKRLDPRLVMLRDPKVHEFGSAAIEELRAGILDRNYRIVAERGELHVFNDAIYLHGDDPDVLFADLQRLDPKIDAPHAFYLGTELAKASIAIQLGKNYSQDRPLRWGMLSDDDPHRDAMK